MRVERERVSEAVNIGDFEKVVVFFFYHGGFQH